VKAAAAAGVAGAAVLAGATPAMAADSFTVTPTTNLVDGQSVGVDLQLNAPNPYPLGDSWFIRVNQCTQPTYSTNPSVCKEVGIIDNSEYQFITTWHLTTNDINIGMPAKVFVKKSWTSTSGTTTCTNQCYLVAGGKSAAIAFKAPK
jgi:hypothetical protein